MTDGAKQQLLYLNRENRWLDFSRRGLELKDGELRLASLPLFETTRLEELGNLPAPDGPAGLAVGDDGTIYFSDPAQHRVLSINPCDGETRAVACLGSEGSAPNSFRTPRGLLFDARRKALYVADSGNHRIQIFNVETFQLVDIWGPVSTPQPSDQPGSFNTPWSLASDSQGNVYVVDFGNQRLQKFDVVGRVVPSFWETAAGYLDGAAPAQVAVASTPEGERVVVLGKAQGAVKIFLLDTAGHLWLTIDTDQTTNALGLAVSNGSIYVGDNEHLRILKFWIDGTFVGEVYGYNGPVAALAFDQQGRLLVHTGASGVEILHVAAEGAFAKHGFIWGGPFVAGDPLPKAWFSLKALPDQLPADAQLRLFTHFADDEQTPPVVLEDEDEPFPSTDWQPLSRNVLDGLISGAPRSFIWVAVEFSGEGLSSPALSQLTLEYNHEGYLRYLPAIYREDPIKRAFLENFLALYESFFDDTERDIRKLSRLFDPQGTRSEFLSWLAGWLALDVDENWSEEKQRLAIAKVFDLYGRRGTAAGLREALRFFAGIDAYIEEPILYASWWALPADAGDESQGGMLGFNTTLAAEEAQGAVVGSTATYDQSSLITEAEFGAPLFSNVAHRFVVRLHKAQVGGPARQKQLEAIIEREKPAHTMAHVCLIEPGIKVGVKAQLGIDSVLGGQPSLARLDGSSLSSNLQLGGHPAGRLGQQSRVGQTTRLGDVSPDVRSTT